MADSEPLDHAYLTIEDFLNSKHTSSDAINHERSINDIQVHFNKPRFDLAVIITHESLIPTISSFQLLFQSKFGLATHVIYLKDVSRLKFCITDLKLHEILYVIIVNEYSQIDDDYDVYVLSDIIEHQSRMHYDEAISFIKNDLENYMCQVKEVLDKSEVYPHSHPRNPVGFIDPDKNIRYLFCLLMDNRMLLKEELMSLSAFIKLRKTAISQVGNRAINYGLHERPLPPYRQEKLKYFLYEVKEEQKMIEEHKIISKEKVCSEIATADVRNNDIKVHAPVIQISGLGQPRIPSISLPAIAANKLVTPAVPITAKGTKPAGITTCPEIYPNETGGTLYCDQMLPMRHKLVPAIHRIQVQPLMDVVLPEPLVANRPSSTHLTVNPQVATVNPQPQETCNSIQSTTNTTIPQSEAKNNLSASPSPHKQNPPSSTESVILSPHRNLNAMHPQPNDITVQRPVNKCIPRCVDSQPMASSHQTGLSSIFPQTRTDNQTQGSTIVTHIPQIVIVAPQPPLIRSVSQSAPVAATATPSPYYSAPPTPSPVITLPSLESSIDQSTLRSPSNNNNALPPHTNLLLSVTQQPSSTIASQSPHQQIQSIQSKCNTTATKSSDTIIASQPAAKRAINLSIKNLTKLASLIVPNYPANDPSQNTNNDNHIGTDISKEVLSVDTATAVHLDPSAKSPTNADPPFVVESNNPVPVNEDILDTDCNTLIYNLSPVSNDDQDTSGFESRKIEIDLTEDGGDALSETFVSPAKKCKLSLPQQPNPKSDQSASNIITDSVVLPAHCKMTSKSFFSLLKFVIGLSPFSLPQQNAVITLFKKAVTDVERCVKYCGFKCPTVDLLVCKTKGCEEVIGIIEQVTGETIAPKYNVIDLSFMWSHFPKSLNDDSITVMFYKVMKMIELGKLINTLNDIMVTLLVKLQRIVIYTFQLSDTVIHPANIVNFFPSLYPEYFSIRSDLHNLNMSLPPPEVPLVTFNPDHDKAIMEHRIKFVVGQLLEFFIERINSIHYQLDRATMEVIYGSMRTFRFCLRKISVRILPEHLTELADFLEEESLVDRTLEMLDEINYVIREINLMNCVLFTKKHYEFLNLVLDFAVSLQNTIADATDADIELSDQDYLIHIDKTQFINEFSTTTKTALFPYHPDSEIDVFKQCLYNRWTDTLHQVFKGIAPLPDGSRMLAEISYLLPRVWGKVVYNEAVVEASRLAFCDWDRMLTNDFGRARHTYNDVRNNYLLWLSNNGLDHRKAMQCVTSNQKLLDAKVLLLAS